MEANTMTHYQEWLLKDKVVYVKFWGDISVDELGAAFAKSSDLAIASETPPVHFLHHWGEVTSFPMKLHQLRRMTKNVKGDSRKVGWVVVYGTENIIMRFLGDVFFQMFRVRFRMFLDSEDAINFLKRIDATIDEIPEIPEISPTYQPPQPATLAETETTEAIAVDDVKVETQTTEATVVDNTEDEAQTSEPVASKDDENLVETDLPSTPDVARLLDTDPPTTPDVAALLDPEAPTSPDLSDLLDPEAPTSPDIKLPLETLPSDDDDDETVPVDRVKQTDTAETQSVEASTNGDD